MATQKEIAGHLFLSDKWVRELIKKGVLPANNSRGGMDFDKCRESYINYLKGVNSKQVTPLDEAEPDEVRTTKLKLNTQETKLRKENYQLSVLEKLYAPVEVITVTLQRVSQSWSIRLESFSARIKRAWPDMPPEAKEAIDKVIAEGANELTDMRPDLSDYQRRDHDSSEQWLESIADGDSQNRR